MDIQDEFEKPTSVILFRQSSIETNPSDPPKIISFQKKENKVSDKPPVSLKPKLSTNGKMIDFKVLENSSVEKNNFNANDEFKMKLQHILVNSKPPVTENINNTTSQRSNSDKDTSVLSKVNKNKDQFKDINRKLIKNSLPAPPPRISSVPSKQDNDIEEMSDKVKNVNLKDDEETLYFEDNFDEGSEEFSVGTIKALKLTHVNIDKEKIDAVGGVSQRKEDMATLRPKSPRPIPLKGEKEETIWDKIGTLGRKKRIKEVQEVQAEGKYAIDSPGCATAPVIPPEDYNLEDNEERCMIDPRAYDDAKFLDLLYILKEWINDELASQRIIVQDLSEDLYDGQVLQKLLEKLTGDKLDVPEVTQSEEGQKQKLAVVLEHFNKVLGIQRQSHNKWNVESIHSKNIVAITHLLVALARHFRPPVRLPENVSVEVVVVQKTNGKLINKIVRESLTKAYDDVGMRCERDAFDTLFDHAPDKLQVVKKSLVTFVNKHLNKMNFEVTEIESQFHDGVYLIMLMGLLEGFFVPHYSFHLTPHEFEQKVHNVNFAFELMEETGLQKPKARPEDVVNMDLKSTLRVLYNLFLRYRTIL